MAWRDVVQAGENWREGSPGVAAAYAGTAILGVSLSWVLLFSGVWISVIGLTLAALLIALTVLIEYIKDNKVQNWLERSMWGRGSDGKYASLAESMAQLEVATKN